MATCENKSGTSSTSNIVCNTFGVVFGCESSSSTMSGDDEPLDKMPPWKQEFIQRRKNLKVITGEFTNSSLINEETATTTAGSDIITNMPSAVSGSINVAGGTQGVAADALSMPQSTTSSSSSSSMASASAGHSHSPHAHISSTTTTSISTITAAATTATSVTVNTQQQQQQQQPHQQLPKQHQTTPTTNIGCAGIIDTTACPPQTQKIQAAAAATTTTTNSICCSKISKSTTQTSATTTTAAASSSSDLTSFERETQAQSHSRHGTDQIAYNDKQYSNNNNHTVSSNASTTTTTTTTNSIVAEAKKCIFNKNNISGVKSSAAISTSTNKYINKSSGKSSSSSAVIQLSSSSSSSNMVAVQELMSENFNFDDTSEELQYGPGIVSKLRCRYLSLALRQSVSKQRPSLDNLRRATSLNNLLDENGVDDDDDDDRSDSSRSNWHNNSEPTMGGLKARTPDEYGNNRKYMIDLNENNRRQTVRGNDSLKRARSVEALMRYDHKQWQRDISKDADGGGDGGNNIMIIDPDNGIDEHSTAAENLRVRIPDIITIEDKIMNARERGGGEQQRPKRLTSFMDETERPPPDLVKHTLRLFEATANRRRPRNSPRYGNGEVAAKVATFKTIISQEKPPIVFPKPPLSPKKPMLKPRTPSSPKHLNGNQPNNNNNTSAPIMKMTQPTLDIMSIKNNLEKVKCTSPTTNGINGKKSFGDDNCRSPSPSITSYRSQRIDSPLSPQLLLKPTFGHRPKLDLITSSPLSPVPAPRTIDSPSNVDFNNSPLIELTKKLEGMSIDSTPQQQQQPNPPIDSADDDFDHFDGELLQSKQISKLALANISKAGTTTEFKFSGPSTKSHLPGIMFNGHSLGRKIGVDGNGDATPPPNVRQIGIIRPQIKGQQSVSNNNNNNGTVSLPSAIVASGATTMTSNQKHMVKDNIDLTDDIKQMAPQTITTTATMQATAANEKLKRDNLLITNLLSSNNSATTIPTEVAAATTTTTPAAATTTTTPPTAIDKATTLTSREIEKNLINREKSEEAAAAAAAAASFSPSPSPSTMTTVVATPSKWIPSIGNSNNSNNTNGTSTGTASPQLATVTTKSTTTSSRNWQQHSDMQNTNTMVFNFSNRKEPVPDYIENDGLVIRRKRELPKPGESGFVLLGDLSVETSTDPDDAWTLGPPSPCDVEFMNDNVIIDGKSSIRDKSKTSKFNIQFNDTLTKTFEYPSENSMLEDSSIGGDYSIDNGCGGGSNGNANDNDNDDDSTGAGVGCGAGSGAGSGVINNGLLGSVPLGSAPLGSYTPVKASLNTHFELGVTRSQTSTPTQQQQQKQQHHHDINDQSYDLSSPMKQLTLNGSGDCNYLSGGAGGCGGGGGAAGDGIGDVNACEDISDSLQYLKPATDEQTVAWSEGTRVTDLLF